MSVAPGFLEWQKAEDKRILLEGIKRHEATVEANLIKKEKEDADNNINSKYYDRMVYVAYQAWSTVNFSLGPEYEAYMSAQKTLGEHILKLKELNDTSRHTPSE
jgi:hypothetical protein